MPEKVHQHFTRQNNTRTIRLFNNSPLHTVCGDSSLHGHKTWDFTPFVAHHAPVHLIANPFKHALSEIGRQEVRVENAVSSPKPIHHPQFGPGRCDLQGNGAFALNPI